MARIGINPLDYNGKMINMAKRQTLHIWIALMAVLFSALAPAVSHALTASGGAADTLEICTVNGYKLVKLAGANSDKAPDATRHAMEHCAFCTIHGDPHGLPATPSTVVPLDTGHDLYPPLFYSAPRTAHAWSTANPRAPPALA
jgi:hypothetical protein